MINCANNFEHYFLHLAQSALPIGMSIAVGTPLGQLSNIGAYEDHLFGNWKEPALAKYHVNYEIKLTCGAQEIFVNPIDYHNEVSLFNMEWGTAAHTPIDMAFRLSPGLNKVDIEIYIWDTAFQSILDYLEKIQADYRLDLSWIPKHQPTADVYVYTRKIIAANETKTIWEEYLCPGIYTVADGLYGTMYEETPTNRWSWELLNSAPVCTGIQKYDGSYSSYVDEVSFTTDSLTQKLKMKTYSIMKLRMIIIHLSLHILM